jgi:hypothetical protein
MFDQEGRKMKDSKTKVTNRSLFALFGIVLAMVLLAVFMPGNTDEAHAKTGYCTSASPYLIENEADWNEFAQNVDNGNTYSGRIIRLTDDIIVSKVAGSRRP